MRIRFLVNPAAGGGRGARLLEPVRRAAAAAGAEVEVSSSGRELGELARRAANDGIDRVVAVGGDGTVHLVIQALAGGPVELAVVPAGRGDDFAASVGIPSRPEPACRLALIGEARAIDLGRAGESWFGLYAGVGFDSAVTETANEQPRWLPSALTYVVATLRTLLRFRPPQLRLEHDGGVWEGEAMFATVCNAPRFGGGMRIAPGARLTDGILDLVVVEKTGRLALLLVFPRVFAGTHVSHPAVSIFRTRAVRIEVRPAALMGSDGEVLGRVESVQMDVVPGALRVVTGRPPDGAGR